MYSLKDYDKYLKQERFLDGNIIIKRNSPFSSTREHNILELKNQYTGSMKWVLNKLTLMDTQKFNIIGNCVKNNLNIRNRREDDRMSRDIADFYSCGGNSIIL